MVLTMTKCGQEQDQAAGRVSEAVQGVLAAGRADHDRNPYNSGLNPEGSAVYY